MPHDGEVPTPEIPVFGDRVAGVLSRILGEDLLGVYFVGAPPEGADLEVSANVGRRMTTAVHLDATDEYGFWYVLDRAIAHRSGVAISGPPSRKVFADVPRRALQAGTTRRCMGKPRWDRDTAVPHLHS